MMLCRCRSTGRSVLGSVSQRSRMSTAPRPSRPDGTSAVRHIIAVSSCKGGVGKSTVAVNLACALLGQGKRVGIFDADLYGPSLPTMTVPPNGGWACAKRDGRIIPPNLHSMPCMSYGFVAPGTGGRGGTLRNGPAESGAGGAAVMRGPMVSNVVQELLTQTEWGELDYLIVDMPPGTGDIHLTLCQRILIDASVVVTTPQRLSFVDVVKGIEMFGKLKVPTVAVVENMAWFVCEETGTRHYVFGRGHRERLVAEYGFKNAFSVPLEPDISEAGDSGVPLVLSHPNSRSAEAYAQLAQGVVHEVRNLGGPTPRVTYEEERGSIVVRCFDSDTASEYVLPPVELRRRLRRVEDMLGHQARDVPEDVVPRSIEAKGSYAVSIVWSDGHDATIYPFEDIRRVAEEYLNELGRKPR